MYLFSIDTKCTRKLTKSKDREQKKDRALHVIWRKNQITYNLQLSIFLDESQTSMFKNSEGKQILFYFHDLK